MSLVYSQDELMLLESAEGLLGEQSPVSEQRALRDANTDQAYNDELWQSMVEMGWTAIPFAEEYGGLAFGYKGLGAVFTQIGHNLSASPLLSSVVLCGSLIENLGTESQKDQWLTGVISGDLRLALASEESHIYDPKTVESTLKPTADGYALNGKKVLVADGVGADGYLVVAKLNSQLRLVYVSANSAGVSVDATKLVDARNMAKVTFDDVVIGEDAVLGNAQQTFSALELSQDLANACLSAEIFGASEALFNTTLEYLKTRKQFDQFIGSFQALQHRAAECFVEIELAKSTLMNALAAIDGAVDDKSRTKAVSLAKWKVNQMADLVTKEAIQMHGGIGVTDELDVGLYLKRIRVAQMHLGDADYHQMRYQSCLDD
ncbi:acyl-CoA dehydrogenase family protein (plasmid) [Vibrio alfacsensis]|uniref:acyl-CoA dehydrogenase family protein n=1 Tax=Vibrio alfacsensis TaxID=1074311 RepID=UPI002ADDE6DC|nr:acyl-CoA dehydrogenase family protein [Vibrio alfacsensis]WQE79061.1 acyl-CoA dehydrogenase family protein [Vibrio alfacsensis]